MELEKKETFVAGLIAIIVFALLPFFIWGWDYSNYNSNEKGQAIIFWVVAGVVSAGLIWWTFYTD